MKKIGIDARLLYQTGVGTYLRNLLFYLQQIDQKNFLYFIYLLKNDYHKISFKKNNFVKKIADFKWHTFNEQIGYYYFLNKENLDLVHFTYFGYPVFYHKPFIATVHDTTPLRFKTGLSSTKNFFVYEMKHLVFRFVLKKQLDRAKLIITPTKTVAEEISQFYGEEYIKKIIPLYEGINYELIKVKEKKINKKFSKPFFIYVGNFYPHKNIGRLIAAIRLLKEIKHNLILIGPDDFFKKKLLKEIAQYDLEKKIFFYHLKEISELVYFYKNAAALIHPSLSEGFGLPLLEAAYFNCPIIASNIPVFQELLGKEYLSFNPYQIEDIADKINYFLINKPTFNYKKLKKKFSFKRMAGETFFLYQKVLERLNYENSHYL